MVIDTSAIIAFLLNEPEALRIQEAFLRHNRRTMSAVNFLEAHLVCSGGRLGSAALTGLERLYGSLSLVILPFDESQARLAASAFNKYGKGQGHPAQLNMGDCAAYALAKSLQEPLLFVGNDFTHTDIESC